jgi:hypothetical protein
MGPGAPKRAVPWTEALAGEAGNVQMASRCDDSLATCLEWVVAALGHIAELLMYAATTQVDSHTSSSDWLRSSRRRAEQADVERSYESFAACYRPPPCSLVALGCRLLVS